jgi:hypothetical protein
MKRLALVAVLAGLAVPAQASSGPSLLAVRPNGQFGPLVLYDLDSLRADLRLSAGLQSADAQTFVAARATGTRTSLTRYALPSGRVVARGALAGRQRLAAVSARGDRAVLTSFRPGWTRLTVVGTSRWTVFRRIDLRGTYGVEAVSLDARRLFLIKYDDGGYNLRLYDLRTSRLAVTPLVEGASAQQKMIGAAWTSVATSDGRWLLTLYIKPEGGGFIHSLDLDRGFGHCLDLPTGFVDPSTIRTSSLALSPDERRLYIAGPFAGRLLVVDLAGPRIARIVRFRNGERTRGTRDLGGAAAVSPREDTVAFAVDGRVWRYRLATDAVDEPVRVGRVAGLGFTPDGRRLVVVRRGAAPKVLR